MNGTGIKEDAACRSWIEWTPELERDLLTPDEILDVRLKSRIMCALIDAREERNISLRDVAAMSGVNRSGFFQGCNGSRKPVRVDADKTAAAIGLDA